jgi:hypothetical protein
MPWDFCGTSREIIYKASEVVTPATTLGVGVYIYVSL